MAPDLTDEEILTLIAVVDAHLENIIECREETSDSEYTQDDEDACSALLFALSDYDYDPESIDCSPLHDAIWIAMDTPLAFDDIDFDVLTAAAIKVGYEAG